MDIRKALVLLTYFVTLYLLWCYKAELFGIVNDNNMLGFEVLYAKLIGLVMFFYALLGLFFLIVILGTPLQARRVSQGFRRVGFVNHAGEEPMLLRSIKKKNPNVTVMEFEANGIPKSKWKDKRQDIETVLNLMIVKIVEGKDKRRLLLHTVNTMNALPEKLYWQERYLSQKGFKILLGESLLGKEMVNLARTPHLLIGGSTGSGKSVLLKLLLMQCIKKDAQIYIADFKGGVDFPPVWSKYCKLIIEASTLLETLNGISNELERRKTVFRSEKCANIDEYNKLSKENLSRIVFACDEVAEILDKTGIDKAGKDLIATYENRLATIARQGRAFGIHLMLATQRPDANILAGQIRNNIDFRVCGRADKVLSQIILDSTEASEQIPKDAQGRFITGDGMVFQVYLF
jgi:S-DNA-T family DNA segregation ATPase FtsK/SpoIIIE